MMRECPNSALYEKIYDEGLPQLHLASRSIPLYFRLGDKFLLLGIQSATIWNVSDYFAQIY